MEHHIQVTGCLFSVALEPAHIFEVRDLRLELDKSAFRWQFNPQILKKCQPLGAQLHPAFVFPSGELSLVLRGKKMLFITKSTKWLYSVYAVLTKYIQWLCSCSDSKESEWAGKAKICSQYNYRFLIIVTSMLTQLNKLQPAAFGFEEESLRWCESC